jgi:transposase
MRNSFVWPLVQQTLKEVIAGLDAAWGFFGGIPKRLILDNFPAAVAGTDPLEPRPTAGFLEYSQARSFLIDPARRRHARDKPKVERAVPYVRERFFTCASASLRERASAVLRTVAARPSAGVGR